MSLTAAFSTVPAADAEEIKRCWSWTLVEQIARDDGRSPGPSSCSRSPTSACGLTAELDGVKKEGVPLPLDLDQLERRLKAPAGARAGSRRGPSLYCWVSGAVRHLIVNA